LTPPLSVASPTLFVPTASNQLTGSAVASAIAASFTIRTSAYTVVASQAMQTTASEGVFAQVASLHSPALQASSCSTVIAFQTAVMATSPTA
jgi:hypothetical protein